jgi:hypothetical protein
MMPTLASMDVPKKLLALVSRYALQSDAIWETPVQVTIFDAVSRGLAYYPFGFRLVCGKLAIDEKALSLRIQSTPSYLANTRRTRSPKGGPQSRAPCSGGGGKAGGRSTPGVDGEVDGLKRRSSKTPAGCAR